MLSTKESFRKLSNRIIVLILVQMMIISVVGFNSTNVLAIPTPDEKIRMELSFSEETYSQDFHYNHSINDNWNSTIWEADIKVTQQVFFYFTEQGNDNDILANSYLSLVLPNNEEYMLNDYTLANSEREYNISEDFYVIRGFFHADIEGEWGLKINYDEDHDIGDYNIIVKFPNSGYSFQYPREVYNRIKIADGYFTMDTYQYRYWKVFLGEGQRTIIELSGMGLVLGSQIEIFESSGLSLNDYEIIDNNLTRIEFYPLSTQNHYLRILIPPGSFIGDYIPYSINITKALEEGYNFETAIELTEEDQIVEMYLEYFDSRYIKIDTKKSTITRIIITESISSILSYLEIEFYNDNHEILAKDIWYNFTYNSYSQQLLIDFDSKITGNYYLKITHNWQHPDGQISIRFETTLNPLFEITNNNQIIGIIALTTSIALLVSFIHKKHDDYYWFLSIKSLSCIMSRKDIFHSFKERLEELERTKTVKIFSIEKNKKITFKVKEIQKNIITYFSDSLNKETTIHIMDVPSILTYIITVGTIVIIFTLFNLVSAVFTSSTYLPLNLDYAELVTIFLIASSITLSCSIYHTFIQKKHGQRTVSWIKNEKEIIESTYFAKNNKNKRDFMIKSKIHQSRRLWNQAMKSYKSTQFNSFVIKADSALFHALEARYYQISADLNPPTNFLALCNIVRNKNFDIPSQKVCERFRKTRNGVVHGSINMDTEEASKILDFSTKFFNRLGISNK